MKIAGLSDLHGYLPDNIPTCEVLCISGDIIPLQIQKDFTESHKWWLNTFCEWVKKLPCKKVIFTAGSHDFYLEELYINHQAHYYAFIADLENKSNDKAILLIDEKYTYKGINFYGFPYIRPVEFQEGKWAFEDNYIGVNDIGVYSSIPKAGIDVLITYDTPFKNTCLDNVIESIQDKPIIFCGHWHDMHSDKFQNIYNCSIRDDYYNIKRNFEIPIIDLYPENVEDKVPLPVTGEVIEEEYGEDDY